MAKIQKILSAVVFYASSTLAGPVNGTMPQRLKTKLMNVCGPKLKLEIAQTPEQRSIGLMNRSDVPKGTGMIFVFPTAEIRQFWMRNVPFDIDIAYFDSKGKYLNSHTMLGTSPLMQDEQLPRYSSDGAAKFAVEARKGFFRSIDNLSTCRLSPLLSSKN